jgi:hypothetical protein
MNGIVCVHEHLTNQSYYGATSQLPRQQYGKARYGFIFNDTFYGIENFCIYKDKQAWYANYPIWSLFERQSLVLIEPNIIPMGGRARYDGKIYLSRLQEYRNWLPGGSQEIYYVGYLYLPEEYLGLESKDEEEYDGYKRFMRHSVRLPGETEWTKLEEVGKRKLSTDDKIKKQAQQIFGQILKLSNDLFRWQSEYNRQKDILFGRYESEIKEKHELCHQLQQQFWKLDSNQTIKEAYAQRIKSMTGAEPKDYWWRNLMK